MTDGRRVIVSFGSEGLYRLRLRRQAPLEARPRRAQLRLVLRSRLRMGHRQLADHLEEHGDRAVRHPEELVHRGVRRRDRRARLANGSARRFRPGRRRRSSRATAAPSSSRRRRAFTRGYDPSDRQGAVAHAPATPRLPSRRRSSARASSIVTNGYRGVQPIVAIKPGARATSRSRAKRRRATPSPGALKRGGPYIPTPVIYRRSALRPAEQRRRRRLRRRDRPARLPGAAGSQRRIVQRLAGRRRREGLFHERRRRRLRRQGWPDLRTARDQSDRRDSHGLAGDLRRRAVLSRGQARIRCGCEGQMNGAGCWAVQVLGARNELVVFLTLYLEVRQRQCVPPHPAPAPSTQHRF